MNMKKLIIVENPFKKKSSWGKGSGSRERMGHGDSPLAQASPNGSISLPISLNLCCPCADSMFFLQVSSFKAVVILSPSP